MTTRPLPVLFLLCAWLLTSCGGSTSVAGIGGTGITTTGTITGFGSIIVNGIRFETDAANSIIVDDMSFDDQSALGLGMVVTVTGTVNDDGVTGNAETIFYDDEIEGPVSGLTSDMSTLSFTILGQAVTASANPAETVFENFVGTGFTSIVDGDFVEVSGFVDSTVTPPVIRATRIEKKGDSNNPSMVEIEGSVGNLNEANQTFDLGTQMIEYNSNTVFENMVEADLIDGLFVEVKGDLTNNVIVAVRIEREEDNSGSGSDPDEGSKVSLKGIVSEFAGIGSFVVLGQEVDATNAEFKPESLRDSIADGVIVEVEGIIENGILIAEEVED